jgi:hypothetical protein
LAFHFVLDSWREGVYPPVVKERVRNGTNRKGIEAFPLERKGTPTASVVSEGVYTPMAMERVRNTL